MNFHQICIDITFGQGLLDFTHIFILTGRLSLLYLADAICKATGGLLLKIKTSFASVHRFLPKLYGCITGTSKIDNVVD